MFGWNRKIITSSVLFDVTFFLCYLIIIKKTFSALEKYISREISLFPADVFLYPTEQTVDECNQKTQEMTWKTSGETGGK